MKKKKKSLRQHTSSHFLFVACFSFSVLSTYTRTKTKKEITTTTKKKTENQRKKKKGVWSALLAALLQLLHAKEKLLHSVPLRLIEARQVVGKERLFQSAQTCKLGRREGVGAVFVEQGTKERLLSF